MHGPDAVPGDRQPLSVLGSMRCKVLVHRETWRKGSRHRGNVTVYQDKTPAGVPDYDKDKFALDWALALAGESNEAHEVELTTVPAT